MILILTFSNIRQLYCGTVVFYKDKQQTFHSLQRAKIVWKLMGTKTAIKKSDLKTLFFNLFK